METDDFEKELTKLRGLLEEYANGGFDLIRSKKEDDLAFFGESENCFWICCIECIMAFQKMDLIAMIEDY